MFWVVKNYGNRWKFSKLWYNFKFIDIWIFENLLEYFWKFYCGKWIILYYWDCWNYWEILEFWHNCNSNYIDDTYEWEKLTSWHSFASWLCEEMIKIVKSVWNGKKIKKMNQWWNVKARVRWTEQREGSLGERPKSLPREDSEWGVYLGADAYPLVKAWEWQCIVWLCVTCSYAFYLIVEYYGIVYNYRD